MLQLFHLHLFTLHLLFTQNKFSKSWCTLKTCNIKFQNLRGLNFRISRKTINVGNILLYGFLMLFSDLHYSNLYIVPIIDTYYQTFL